MNYKEICTKTLNIEKLEAYNNFWDLVYKTIGLTKQEKDELVSTIMKQYPTISLIDAEMYLAKLITEHIENRGKQ